MWTHDEEQQNEILKYCKFYLETPKTHKNKKAKYLQNKCISCR